MLKGVFYKKEILPLLLLISVSLPNSYIGTLLILIVFVFLNRNLIITIPIGLEKSLRLFFSMFIWMVFSFALHPASLQNLFWGIFTLSSFLITPLLLKRLCENVDIGKILKKYIVLEFGFYIIQYTLLVLNYRTINPFSATLAAGDFLSGTSIGNSHQIAVTMGLISLYYLPKVIDKSVTWAWFFLPLIMFLASSYVSAFIVFGITMIIYLVRNIYWELKKLRIKKKSFVLLTGIFLVALIFAISQFGNIQYGLNVINTVGGSNTPRKIIGLQKTFLELPSESSELIFTGTGLGTYSSRAALITGGEYLTPQPSFIPTTPSFYTKKYILPLWNRELTKRGSENSVANQPFVQFQSIFGEGGVIALLLFIAGFLVLLKGRVKDKSVFLLVVFALGIFFFDMWVEYPSFALFFWFLVYAEKKEVKKIEY